MNGGKTFEELSSKELRTVCKENGISYSYQKDGQKHTMTKQEMVNALYDKMDAEENNDEVVENETITCENEDTGVVSEEVPQISIDDETPLDVLYAAREEIDRLIAEKRGNVRQNNEYEDYDENYSMYGGVNPYTFIHTRNKERYIEEAEVGVLIAFLDKNGKPRTAALVNRSSKRKMLLLETEYGWRYEVPYECVLWVKRGEHWAANIYRILKRYDANGKCAEREVFERTAERIDNN